MDFEEYVNNLKRKFINKQEILFVCIGNSNILWDSIGPVVGTFLKEKIGNKFVLGDINDNICNKLDLDYNYFKMKNKFIVAIDTAIWKKTASEEIFVSNKPITMGLALNKNKGIIGDVSIKIAISDLKKINMKYIYNMSEFIVNGIIEAIDFVK